MAGMGVDEAPTPGVASLNISLLNIQGGPRETYGFEKNHCSVSFVQK